MEKIFYTIFFPYVFLFEFLFFNFLVTKYNIFK